MAETTCWFCKRPINPLGRGVFKYVKGWVERRAGGGANAVHLMEDLEHYAHKHCVDEAKLSPVHKQQASFPIRGRFPQ